MAVSNRLDGVSYIKDKICDVIYKRNEKLLPCLIALFKENLSVRKTSSIQDINHLFDTLYRMNLGSIHNLWAFVKISEFLNDQDLCKLIDDVARLEIPDYNRCTLGKNLYAERRANKSLLRPPSISKDIEDSVSVGPSRVAPQPVQQSSQVKSRTFDLLACEIGRRWRELGRSLGYHDADLDEFEERHRNNLRERIHDMLEEYARSRSFSSEEEMLNDICKALETCRRVDLRKRVQNFMAKNI